MTNRGLCIAVLVLAARPAYAQPVPPPATPPLDVMAALAEGPPMTADRAAELAARAAPALDRARALAQLAEASVARARAAMVPRLDLTARYTHVDGFTDGQVDTGTPDPDTLAALRVLAESVSDPAARTLWLGTIDRQASSTGVTFAIPRDQYGLAARLSWPASDLFFAMLPALEAAEINARAREHQVSAVEAQVRRSAREAFYRLARARGALVVAEQAARAAESQRARVEASVRAGYFTEADRLGAEARVASAEQMIAAASMGVEIADAALRALIDVPDGSIFGIAENIFDEVGQPAIARAAALERALSRRHELAAIRASIASQRAAARASDASGYPRLVLYGGADLAAPNRYIVPPNSDLEPSWEVGATLTWSPNDTWAAVHRGQELSAQVAATQAELAQLERAVRLEVTQAHASLGAAERTLVSARRALAAAEAAYESRDAQLRAGDATTTDLFAAQTDLDRARLAVLDAAVQVRASRADLAYATGE